MNVQNGYANVKGTFNFILLQTLWERNLMLMFSEHSETNILTFLKMIDKRPTKT